MLSKLSVKKPYTVVVSVVLALILGVVSFGSMTVDLLPDISLPYAIVITTYNGANPEMVEMVVTKPIEQSMATVTNISNITSTSSEGMSTVMLEFSQTVDMDSVTVDIRESLDMIEGYWPDDVGSPLIMKLNPDMMPIMVAAVGMQDAHVVETTEWVEDEILPQLESIEGVASVSVMGALESTVEVKVNQEKLSQVNKKVQSVLKDTFADAEEEITSAISEVTISQSSLDDGASKLASQKTEMSNSLLALNAQEKELETAYNIALETAYAEVLGSDELLELEAQIDFMKANIAATPEEIQVLNAQYQTVLTEANTAAKAAVDGQFDTAFGTIADGKSQLEEGIAALDAAAITTTVEIATAKAEISSVIAQLKAGQEELESAKESALEGADLSGLITTQTITGILAAQNFSLPAGYVEEDKDTFLVRVGDKFTSIEEIEAVPLFDMEIDGLDTILLRDVAEVSFVTNAEEVYASINGESGLILSFQKQTGYATGEVSKRITEKFDEILEEEEFAQIAALMDQGIYIDLIVDSVMDNMIYGALLAILILLLFLKSLRPTLVIAISIPISIVVAIVLMYFSGITLNIISLSGLALGVGMLVDNSIVVIENITRMNNLPGMTPAKAAVKGANQVSGAIIASTLTTVCVFLPIVFVEGMTRQLFVDMGLTIAYSLLASLLVALTVVPMLLSRVMRKEKKDQGIILLFMKKIYARTLVVALRGNFIVVILAVGLLFGSISLALSNGYIFMPEMESTQITMTMKMEKGSTMEETTAEADQYVKALLEIKDVKDVGAMVSSSGMMGMGEADPENVSLYAILHDNMTMSSTQLEKAFYAAAEDINAEVTVTMSSMDMSALGGSGIVVKVKGKELDILQEISLDLAEIMGGVEGTTNITTGLEGATEELRVVVDKEEAALEGLLVASVYQEIADKISDGTVATVLSTESKDYDVKVVEEEKINYTRDDIKELTFDVSKSDGTVKEVKLEEIATFETAQSLPSISRENQVRTMSITAEVESGYNISFVGADIKAAIEAYELPEAYIIETAGEDDSIMETIYELLKMLGMAILFMYLIMVAQFQSVKSPFIIMFTVPLAFTGGFLALWIAAMEVSAIAMVGFVMLSGIIVNNGIVLVDYTNQLIESGVPKKDALVEAGITRLRSIIMTALTTVLGLSTMALGVGMGSDMMQPMAVVTVGGLLYGTILTLYVVPCIYDLFNRNTKIRTVEIGD